MATSTVQLATTHILHRLERHREYTAALQPSTIRPPLFVAIQGPQGSGKTYLTSQLRDILSSPQHHSLSVAVLSIDDLYLPHVDLVALADAHRENVLLQGRGQPGTHDVELGKALMHELRHINDDGPVAAAAVLLPTYDKSLHDGAGDRTESVVTVHPPVDVVILEGWCVGFFPVTKEEIEKRWTGLTKGIEDRLLSMPCYRKEDVLQLNELLQKYVELWDFFTVFIQIKTAESSYSVVYKWRLEQEHELKSHNGGKGMDDAQVRRFVDRYIPGYIFFGDGMTRQFADGTGKQHPCWLGNGMAVTVGEEREVLGVEYF